MSVIGKHVEIINKWAEQNHFRILNIAHDYITFYKNAFDYFKQFNKLVFYSSGLVATDEDDLEYLWWVENNELCLIHCGISFEVKEEFVDDNINIKIIIKRRSKKLEHSFIRNQKKSDYDKCSKFDEVFLPSLRYIIKDNPSFFKGLNLEKLHDFVNNHIKKYLDERI